MEIKTFIVDSFTTEKFKGNPAGVCILENDISARSLLAIAQELGLSETAYVKKIEANKGGVQTFLEKYCPDRLNKKVMKAFQSSTRTGHC